MRDVRIMYAQGWRKSRIIKTKEEGYYNDCTISLLTDVQNYIADKDLIKRWDNVSLPQAGELRTRFHYHEILDAERMANDDYKVNEHNKGDWAK